MNESNGKKLPHNWILAKLPQIALLNPSLDRCPTSQESQVTFVPMSAVDPEHGGLNRPESRPFSEVRKGYTNFLSGDILFAKITPCMENGKICVVPKLPNDVGYGSTEFHVLRPKAGVSASWVSQYMSQVSFRRLARSRMTGSAGQMRVPTFFLEEVEIPVPPPLEQTQILEKVDELFSDLDAGVALLEKIARNLDRYRASILKAAVEGKLSAAWRKKHKDVEPANELLKRILAQRRSRWEKAQLSKFNASGKEPPNGWKERYEEPSPPDTGELPELPKGWCWASVDQLAYYVRNGWSLKPNPSSPGIPILRINAVRPMKVVFDDLRYVPESEDEVKGFFVQSGDLLFTRYNGSLELLGVGGLVVHPVKA
jgi:type I restriction enzyme S subunit